MSETTALAFPKTLEWNDELKALAKQTVCKGASDAEFALFIEHCKVTGLNPFARQIYSVRRKQWNSQTRSHDEYQVTQVSIDGFRLIAERTTRYAGQVGPWWCGPDSEWKEVWLADEPPAAAKVGVLRHDFHQPLYAIALYKSYVQTYTKDGKTVVMGRWNTDPAGMLAKCAESLALRRAFPQELSGLYTTEEMDKTNSESAVSVTWQPLPEQPTSGTDKLPAPAEKVEATAQPEPETFTTPTNSNGNTTGATKPAANGKARMMVAIGKVKWPKDWIDAIQNQTGANPFHIGAALELIGATPDWADNTATGATVAYLNARKESRSQEDAKKAADEYIAACIDGTTENG